MQFSLNTKLKYFDVFIIWSFGWVGKWVGCIFIQFTSFFWYINKQNVLISNLVSKMLYSFFIKIYDHFLFCYWRKIFSFRTPSYSSKSLFFNRAFFFSKEKVIYNAYEDQSMKNDWNAPWWYTYNLVQLLLLKDGRSKIMVQLYRL